MGGMCDVDDDLGLLLKVDQCINVTINVTTP